MSKVGKQCIVIDNEIKISSIRNLFFIEGPYGKMSIKKSPVIEIKNKKNIISIKPLYYTNHSLSLWGLLRSLLSNMVTGIKYQFLKKIIITGIGYKAKIIFDNILVLTIGYNHEVVYHVPTTINISCYKNSINVKGVNKYLVGQICSDVRLLKNNSPYLDKGVRYYKELFLKKSCKKNDK